MSSIDDEAACNISAPCTLSTLVAFVFFREDDQSNDLGSCNVSNRPAIPLCPAASLFPTKGLPKDHEDLHTHKYEAGDPQFPLMH